MNRRTLSLTALAVLAAISLTACGGKASNNTAAPIAAGTPVKGGTYTVATVIDATFLNTILNQDQFSNEVNAMIFDSLLNQNDKMEWVPSLATELPKTEDGGKKWTFKLRDGVKWQDGVDFSSADVKFTFAAILHPGYTGVRASGLTAIKGVTALRDGYKAVDADVTANKLTKEQGDQKKVAAWEAWKQSDAIQVPDKTSVIFLFDKPFAPAMANIAGRGILPEHLLKDEVGAKMKDSKFNRNPVGTGRFSFVEWKANDRIVLKANDNWFGGRPNIDQYIIRVFPDNNTAMAALEKGEIDRADVAADQFDRFKNDVKNVNMIEYPTLNYRNISLDQKNPLFTDKNVRYALAYAMDKETLVKQLLLGHGITAWSHGSPSRWDYSDKVMKFEYNKDKAKQLLDAAGWKPGPDGIRVKDGKKFSFDFYYVGSTKTEADAAQVIQAAWKEVGVEANLKSTDQPTLLDLSDAGNPNRKQPPAYLLGWNVGTEPDSYSIWACDGTFNDISYCNKQVDDLLNQGRAELDQSKRAPIYAKLQEQLAADQPYIWLWFPNKIVGLSKRMAGPIAGTPVGIEWNIEKWWIQPGK
ncbi:MAG: oligopeptide transporter substrate-binding protein [Firmicutes bacterium]|nr:oligopeptide transporter substrate-binding protein [Bacillota bacterium]